MFQMHLFYRYPFFHNKTASETFFIPKTLKNIFCQIKYSSRAAEGLQKDISDFLCQVSKITAAKIYKRVNKYSKGKYDKKWFIWYSMSYCCITRTEIDQSGSQNFWPTFVSNLKPFAGDDKRPWLVIFLLSFQVTRLLLLLIQNCPCNH